MNYKDFMNQKLPKSTIVKKEKKKSENNDYFIIDQACLGIANSFNQGLMKPLQSAIESFSSFLDSQELIELPQSFQDLNIINILFTILMNENGYFNLKHITRTISSLKYIFWSKTICDECLTPVIVDSICSQIKNWNKIFKLEKDTFDEEIEAIGDLIQIMNSFMCHDDSTFCLIYSTLPFNFLIDMAQSFRDVYIASCFSSYFYSFYDYADFTFLKKNVDDSVQFFSFCQFCYQNEIKPTYHYNLWSLSEIYYKLQRSFRYDQFIEFKLNEFVNDSILEDDNKIVFPALRIISFFHFPFTQELTETPSNDNNNKKEEEKTEIPLKNPNLNNLINSQFFLIDKRTFIIDNIVIIPKYRLELSIDTKIYSIMTLENVFKYNLEHIILFFKYEMPEFYILEFSKMDYNMKKPICSLLIFIIHSIGNECLLDLIKQGIFGTLIDSLATGNMNLEVLNCFKAILDRLNSIKDFPFIIVLLQDELFQDTLSEIEFGEEEDCAKLATILKKTTNIESDE